MQQTPEQLSALIDDAGEDGDRALLAEIADDPALRRTWARYQMIGEVLRDSSGPFLGEGFAAKVAEQIAREPRHMRGALRPPAPRRTAWRRQPALALALAASVAAIAIFGVTRTPTPDTAPTLALAPAAKATVPRVVTIQPTGEPTPVTWTATQPAPQAEGEYQRRLNSYLVNFGEQRAQLGMPGVHPYVRVVGFEAPVGE
jgi:sigma-E factor negative regulatory protein RseA